MRNEESILNLSFSIFHFSLSSVVCKIYIWTSLAEFLGSSGLFFISVFNESKYSLVLVKGSELLELIRLISSPGALSGYWL